MSYSTAFEPSLWDGWWDSVYEDFRQIVDLMGFDDPEMQFSGFWCQGDGASFTANFSPRKGIVKAVKAYAPQDEKLHAIAARVAELQRRNFYQLHACITRIGWRYAHAYTISADYPCRHHPIQGEVAATSDAMDTLTEIARDLSNWLYRALESDYEWQVADQAGAHCGRIAATAKALCSDYISAVRRYRAAVSQRHEARRDDVPLSATRAWAHAQGHRLRKLRDQWQDARNDYHAALREHKPGKRAYNATLRPAFVEGFHYGKEDV